MPKFSFRPIKSQESISILDASSKSEAESIFAKIKVLPLDKFLKIYEVVKE
jgi:hypothetical protein|tara:strand:+ start:8682 stop:8834 length:153 start_codon:yes stop_codon:yes gene_type:complete